MPFLDILTNTEIAEPTRRSEFLAQLSRVAAEHLSKPEALVMARLGPAEALRFAGSEQPCCLVDLRLIGEPSAAVVRTLSEDLTRCVSDGLGVPLERVFVVFTDVPRRLWAVGGRPLA